MMFQQLSPYLVAFCYSIRNYPFVMQLIYYISAFIYSRNRAKVVVFKFKKSIWPFSVEPVSHSEYLPRNFVFTLISITCILVFVVAYSLPDRHRHHLARLQVLRPSAKFANSDGYHIHAAVHQHDPFSEHGDRRLQG